MSRLKIERRTGNVFTDLGFSKSEAENLLLRSQLMFEVREIAKDLTQVEVAKRFGIRQPRLNDVLRGKIDKVSLDALVAMLNKAGMHVEKRVRRAV